MSTTLLTLSLHSALFRAVLSSFLCVIKQNNGNVLLQLEDGGGVIRTEGGSAFIRTEGDGGVIRTEGS